ncbi:hypothetical protein OTU49_012120 [Cherax quadricarinatus]|uniref:Uncharacterized protein n=1 Tax=Cherax quadricarinatus TaxID=27406 RepID=A0AAW0W173_CHEQU|nr:uncharacterized protein LOC128703444 [Cherax quadricarinatus]
MKGFIVLVLTAAVLLTVTAKNSRERGGGGRSNEDRRSCIGKLCGRNNVTCLNCVNNLNLTRSVLKNCVRGSSGCVAATVISCLTAANSTATSCFPASTSG